MLIRVVLSILGKDYPMNFDSEDKVAKNFTIGEMANNKSTEVPKLVITEKVLVFIEMMQELRNKYGKSITVNSWYRTKSFNRKCGGSGNSAHLYGLAVDFPAKHTESERLQMTKMWEEICKKHGVVGCINYYSNGYHVAAFEDVTHGAKGFAVYDYRGKAGDW